MLRRSATALGLFALVRVTGLVVLAVAAAARGMSVHERLVRWDAQWYGGIAAHGYGFTRVHPDGRHLPDYAFFPLYPVLERALAAVTGLRYVDAGLVVSAAASLVAAAGIYLVGERLHDRRTGVVLVLLWAAVPVAIVQSMAYTEALFTAFTAWAVLAVLRERWLAAGVLAALAGLTRPVGVAVAAAVMIPALLAMRRPRGSAHALAGLLVAPLGWLGYVGWVGLRTGSPRGYFDVAGGWGNSFDGGYAFGHWILSRPPLLAALLVVSMVVLVGLVVLLVRDQEPLALLLLTGVIVLMTLTTSGYFGSRPRYLLPAFPLLLPVAWRLARARPVVTGAVLGALVAGSAVYGAVWLLGSGPP
ncbi:MAG: glycosyltransferase family 39 protein [Nocardioidaceae bacterium]